MADMTKRKGNPYNVRIDGIREEVLTLRKGWKSFLFSFWHYRASRFHQ